MIRALLVDDEPQATKQLAALLESFPGIEVIGVACNVSEAERFLANRTPDVVFLDISMPSRLGFELAPCVPAETRLVFVTAYEGRALDAFAVGAFDYLLKPVDRQRLAVTIDRLRGQSTSESSTIALSLADEPCRDGTAPWPTVVSGAVHVALTGGRGYEAIRLADIAWVEGVRNYTRLQIRDRRPALVRQTLTEWDAVLPSPTFGRIGRSLIVQLAAIRAMQWLSRDQTLLTFEGVTEPLPIGRAATSRLKELVNPSGGSAAVPVHL